MFPKSEENKRQIECHRFAQEIWRTIETTWMRNRNGELFACKYVFMLPNLDRAFRLDWKPLNNRDKRVEPGAWTEQ